MHKISPLPFLDENIEFDIDCVLDKYCGGRDKGEILHGIRILGVPIGNTEFVGTYQQKTLQKLRSAIAAIHNLLSDEPHITTSLYKYSLQHYTSHLLSNNILHHKNITSQYKLYQTQFTSTVNSISQTFLAQMVSNPDANNPSLPMHAWCVVSTPTIMDGMGFHDSHSRLKSFTTWCHTSTSRNTRHRRTTTPSNHTTHIS